MIPESEFYKTTHFTTPMTSTPTKRPVPSLQSNHHGFVGNNGGGGGYEVVEDDEDDEDEYGDYNNASSSDYYSYSNNDQMNSTPYNRPSRRDAHNKCCNNTLWCVRDICGFICALFTWFLVGYAEFVVVKIILLPSSSLLFRNINGLIFQILALLALFSHSRTMFTDPGAVPRGNATKELIEQMGFRQGQVIYKCPKCCSIKPERAHHCSVCQRCIRKMGKSTKLKINKIRNEFAFGESDHHCPWVNNCVGENNQKYFVLFNFYIALLSVQSLILSLHHFVVCIQHDWKECSAYTPPATIVFLIFLIFEALLFTIFTAVMLGTQLQAIWNDETGIEQLKKEQGRWGKKSKMKSLQSVFGRFSIAWFSPFTKPPSHYTKSTHYSNTYFPV